MLATQKKQRMNKEDYSMDINMGADHSSRADYIVTDAADSVLG